MEPELHPSQSTTHMMSSVAHQHLPPLMQPQSELLSSITQWAHNSAHTEKPIQCMSAPHIRHQTYCISCQNSQTSLQPALAASTGYQATKDQAHLAKNTAQRSAETLVQVLGKSARVKNDKYRAQSLWYLCTKWSSSPFSRR